MVLLNGTVKNTLFCLTCRNRTCLRLVHCKELPVPKAWNSLLPRLERTWLPLQGTAGSQRLELLVPGYHCKQLPVPRGWNSCFPTWEPQVTIAKNFQFLKVGTDGSQRGNLRLPWQGTAGSQTLKLTVPNLGTNEVTIARNCRFPEVRIYVFEA